MKKENYKMTNASSAKISAPNPPTKSDKKPKKVQGGDLRSRGN